MQWTRQLRRTSFFSVLRPATAHDDAYETHLTSARTHTHTRSHCTYVCEALWEKSASSLLFQIFCCWRFIAWRRFFLYTSLNEYTRGMCTLQYAKHIHTAGHRGCNIRAPVCLHVVFFLLCFVLFESKRDVSRTRISLRNISDLRTLFWTLL